MLEFINFCCTITAIHFSSKITPTPKTAAKVAAITERTLEVYQKTIPNSHFNAL